MARHGTENTRENNEELYEEFIEKRGVSKITHYRTPQWPRLTARVRKQFTRQKHTWKAGDKFWKLAAEYYGDSKLWWVIAWYNEKPTEAHVKPGGTLFIPFPLEKILSYFEIGAR